jgi:hypothetical protein
MKTFFLAGLLLFVSCAVNAQVLTDSIQYYKGGILYMEMKLKKTGDVGSVLLKNPDPEVQLYFDKYKANSGAMKVFSLLGGFGVGYSAGTALGGQKINPALLGSGAAALIIGFIFNGQANKNLRKSVSAYNRTRHLVPERDDQ